MRTYLLIDSRGAFEAPTAQAFYDLARGLVKEGARVELMLIQNGVMCARRNARHEDIDAVIKGGVAVFADEFALRERAFPHSELVDGVKPVNLATIVDRLADGWNVVWH